MRNSKEEIWKAAAGLSKPFCQGQLGVACPPSLEAAGQVVEETVGESPARPAPAVPVRVEERVVRIEVGVSVYLLAVFTVAMALTAWIYGVAVK